MAAHIALPADDLRPTARPDRVGQGTAVEQSRAVAQVQAAVLVAQGNPRDIDRARTMMEVACRMPVIAEQAFFSFPRGRETITGESIHLARELALCWGNIDHGIVELRRDDDYGESEMMAYSWDMQTNTRSQSTFIVPHRRDTRNGSVRLTDMRDIYENNANNGARRLREAIFSVLPSWFIDEAARMCRATLEAGDGKPIEERAAAAISLYAELGVNQARLEQKLGRPLSSWTGIDLAQLRITHRSITRREISVNEAFPELLVTAEELAAPAPTVPAPVATAPSPVPDGDPFLDEQPAAPTDTGLGPVTAAYTYEQVLAIAVDAGVIPTTARDSSARKVLLQLAADATGREWGVLDDALQAQGPTIVAHIQAQGAEQS
jgi:hypothetical protein